MAQERGTGTYFKVRHGGGHEVVSYGGSIYLPLASKKNQRLLRAEDREKIHIDMQQDYLVKTTHNKKLTTRQTLLQLQHDQKRVKYLDGNLRGKPRNQWDMRLEAGPAFQKRAGELAETRRFASLVLPQITGICKPLEEKNQNHWEMGENRSAEQPVDKIMEMSSFLPLIDLKRTHSLLEMNTADNDLNPGVINDDAGYARSADALHRKPHVPANSLAVVGAIAHKFPRFKLGSGHGVRRKPQILFSPRKKFSIPKSQQEENVNQGDKIIQEQLKVDPDKVSLGHLDNDQDGEKVWNYVGVVLPVIRVNDETKKNDK